MGDQPSLRRAAGILLSVCLWLAPVRAPATEEPTVANGGFEAWDANGLPSGWTCTSVEGTGVFARDPAVLADGSASLRIDRGPAVYVQQVLPAVPNTEYRVRLKLRGRDCSGVVLVVEHNLAGTEPMQGTFDWREVAVTFNSTAQREMMVQLRFRGTGTLWVDSCRVERLSAPGQAVTEESRRLMAPLTWLSRAVDDAKQQDRSWMAAYAAKHRAAARQVVQGWHSAQPRPWAVGQWVRYAVDDSVVVPSSRPARRPDVSVIDCALVGRERLAGKPYWWYEMRQRKARWWFAEVAGTSETGKLLLIEQRRDLVVKLLVDGPAFRHIARCIVRVDREPAYEYRTAGRALLPQNDCLSDMIRPSPGVPAGGSQAAQTALGRFVGRPARRGRVAGVSVPGVPVTGLGALALKSRCLDRRASVLALGLSGARSAITAPAKVLEIRSDVFVSGGGGAAGQHSTDYCRKAVAAGYNLVQNVGRFVGEKRRFLTGSPVFTFGAEAWSVDLFDQWRGSFLGPTAYLDEPYERQLDYRETFRPEGLTTAAEGAAAYVAAVRSRMEAAGLWNGAWVGSCDAAFPVSWYNLKAGCRSFWMEYYTYESQLSYLRQAHGVDFGTRREWSRWIYAPMRGAASAFGGRWGVGVYFPPGRVPRSPTWRQENARHFTGMLTDAYDMGATLLEVYTEDVPGFEEGLHLPALLWKHIGAAQRPAARATDVVVLPRDVLLYWKDAGQGKMWTVVPYDDAIRSLYREYARVTTELVRAGRDYEVVVDDPAVRPPAYRGVHRIGAR